MYLLGLFIFLASSISWGVLLFQKTQNFKMLWILNGGMWLGTAIMLIETFIIGG